MTVRGANAKFESIITAAAEVFAFWGLSRTKIQEVAKAANVAPGTVYLYADSKDSLFDLALKFGMGGSFEAFNKLPLPYSTTKSQTVKWLSELATVEKLLPDFLEPQLLHLPLDKLLGNLFDFLSSHRYAVRIVERSAHEWQDLAFLFFEQIRDPVIGCICRRIQFENPQLSNDECIAIARLVGGAVAFASVHRFFEGGQADNTDPVIYKNVTIDSLVRMIKRN